MKVVLPDSSELELPDGATGLDAARAIGPKLAEQAVLIRQNGTVQDLRLPLADGQPIQILTTRDTDDPDALADGLCRIWSDRALGDELGRRGREGVRRHYTIESSTDALIRVYEDVAGH